METKTRSMVKAVLWTLLGFIVMTGVGFVSTGSWGLGGQMAFANSALGLVTYLIYERLWTRVRWGSVAAAPGDRAHG